MSLIVRELLVLRNGIEVGVLQETDKGGFVFRYGDDYFRDVALPAISLTLPKNSQEHFSDILFPFFFNMLSEGVNRALQSRQLRIDEKDYFGLLAATAVFDTIGAVSVKRVNDER
jgi:serine/threonine-protein kinase HipA